SIREVLGKAKAWDGAPARDFDGYLISRRMVEEWKRFESGQLDRPPDPLSREAHEQSIADFEAAHPTWHEAGDLAHEWNRELWRKEFEAGLISEGSFDAGEAEHPFYVPAM